MLVGMKMDRVMGGGGIGGYGNFGHFGYLDHRHHSSHVIDLDDGFGGPPSSEMVARVVKEMDSSSTVVGVGNMNYIEHQVSKMDTLAGVAIKYGVEVADIKKMNSLVSDFQMFALKTLHIPLPGRHPPSPCLSNGSESPGQCSHDRSPQSRAYPDFLDSFQSLKVNSSQQQKVSPAMSTLQGFYRLKSGEHKRNQSDGVGAAAYGNEDGPFPKQLMAMNPPLNRHRKSKSVANGFFFEKGNLTDGSDSDKWIDGFLRRGQRPNTSGTKTPEILLKEDPSSASGGFSAVKGKGLALRSKASSRTCLAAEEEVNGINSTTPSSANTNAVTDHLSCVRKSSSTPSLQDQEICSSSMWLTATWNLKTDLQALSASAIARPIFDGLPKPITGRRNKAALD